MSVSQKTSGVYAIVNLTTGRRYVGSSVDVFARWKTHYSTLRKGTHHTRALQGDWDSFGPQQFSFVILETVRETHERLACEQRYIDAEEQPYNTCNTAYTRCHPGSVRTPEQVARISAALTGKKKSLEHRAALSRAKRGKPCPKQSEALRGRKLSEETKAKMRVSHTGLTASDESRAKQSAKLKGRIFTPEWKAKIAAAKRGKPWSQRRLDAHRATQAGCSAQAVSMSDMPSLASREHVIN
jgi:group I intron endonuclease